VTVRLGRFRADLEGEKLVGRVEGGELVPYYTRAEIEDGALDKDKLAFLWAKDPADVFFLHVQGSGLVTLPDGEVTRVGFEAHNGHDFVGIGRLLLDRKLIEPGHASAQGIRAWMRENPEKARQIMRENPRYIFFRPIDGEGPIGAQGVALTPGRSLAVDTRYIPLGAPIWLDTTWPGQRDEPLRRLMVAQDVGGAIKGVVRGDFFWGPGEAALEYAGRMKQDGRYWLLLPRSVVERRQLAS
jgi:membrane-bound lytic murein transglycosylase A